MSKLYPLSLEVVRFANGDVIATSGYYTRGRELIQSGLLSDWSMASTFYTVDYTGGDGGDVRNPFPTDYSGDDAPLVGSYIWYNNNDGNWHNSGAPWSNSEVGAQNNKTGMEFDNYKDPFD